MQVQVSFKIELAASARVGEMEQQIQEAGQAAMRAAMKQTIRNWEEQHLLCPQCGLQQVRLEGTVRRTSATVFGRVQAQRRRFRRKKRRGFADAHGRSGRQAACSSACVERR